MQTASNKSDFAVKHLKFSANQSILFKYYGILMLPINGPAPDYRREDLEKAQVKIENYINHGIEPDLSKDEEIALLYAPEILSKARTAWSLNHQA